jgi:tetratricopeptide (TPR) repeat protein
LEEEHPNLRAAVDTAFASGWYNLAARFCVALGWFCYYRSHFAEIVAWMGASWEHRDAITPSIRADFLRECGWFLPSPAHRVEASEESIALYRELGDRHGLAWALGYSAAQRFHDGDIVAARDLAKECLPLARAFDDPPLLIAALYVFGNVQSCDGKVEVARRTFEEGLALARRISDQHATSDMLYSLGDLALAVGEYAQAEAHFRESGALRGAMGDLRGMAIQLRNAAEAACRQGALERGLPLLAEGLRVFCDIMWPMGIGQTLDLLAWLAIRLGQPARAARFLGAEEMFRIIAQYVVWPTARANYERIVGETRSALDDRAFTSAWASGRALTVQLATAEALEWVTTIQDSVLRRPQGE